MKAIISAGRTDCGVTASPEEIAHNPYLLAKMYCGESAGDRIPWSVMVDLALTECRRPFVGSGLKTAPQGEANDATSFRPPPWVVLARAASQHARPVSAGAGRPDPVGATLAHCCWSWRGGYTYVAPVFAGGGGRIDASVSLPGAG